MTPYILPTDIELAVKLLAAGRPDSVIVAALVRRGVDAAAANQIVVDLREGRKVMPQIPLGLEIAAGGRSRPRGVAQPGEQEASQPRGPRRRSEPVAQKPAEGQKSSRALWIIAAVPICFGVVILGVLISNRLHRAGDDAQPAKPRTTASPFESAPPAGSSQAVSRVSVPAGSLPSSSGETGRPGQKP